MNRLIFTSLLCTCFTTFLIAQEPLQLVLLKGHIYSPDSTAIEDAYIISYKTLRAFASNKEGYFEILLEPDDSLKIHHVAFQSLIIKPYPDSGNLIIVMQFEENLIEDVNVREEAYELENLGSNIDLMMFQIHDEFYSAHTRGPILNPYAPKQPSANMVGINFIELFNWIKHKRKK